MGYGLGVFLLAVGAILSFAVRDNISDVNLTVVGYILHGRGRPVDHHGRRPDGAAQPHVAP